MKTRRGSTFSVFFSFIFRSPLPSLSSFPFFFFFRCLVLEPAAMPRSTFSPAGTSVVKESGRQLPPPSAGGRHRPRRALCSAAARLNGLRGSARRHKVPPCRSLRRPHSRDDPPSTAARIRPYVAASLLLLRPSLRRWTGLPRRVNGRWPVCEPAPVSSVSFSTTWATLPGSVRRPAPSSFLGTHAARMPRSE